MIHTLAIVRDCEKNSGQLEKKMLQFAGERGWISVSVKQNFSTTSEVQRLQDCYEATTGYYDTLARGSKDGERLVKEWHSFWRQNQKIARLKLIAVNGITERVETLLSNIVDTSEEKPTYIVVQYRPAQVVFDRDK